MAYAVDSGDVHLDPSQASQTGTRIPPLVEEQSYVTLSIEQ